ncbi:MAG TPA: response regulator [Desulfurivibrio alkaliphilus]|uniref:histidine kinase n=1 Tax=Desulfurivibrio alkaliphilus TaxID=427923 RepID=A0A7C2TGS3_9BACT|nr:response regulator [Desulfurivibrio alkaliphilus]
MAIKRILVVDNNPVIVKLICHFLAEEGYEVKSAADGLDAMRVLESFRPDVIFVDLIMPNISGDKLCRVIRTIPDLQGVRLVVLSAVAADVDIDFRALGADACIAKGPFAQLKGNIREVLVKFVQQPGVVGDRVLGREELHRRDITRELLNVRHYFDAILQNMTDGVVQLNREERRIVFANRAVTSMVGVAEEKLLSNDFFQYLRGEALPLLATAMDTGGPQPLILGEESSLFLGEAQVLVSLLPQAGGDGSSCWLVVQDITERKRVEDIRNRYQWQLEQEISRQTAELAQRNRELQAEVERRKKIEEDLQLSHDVLERRVAERTAEVEKLYRQLLHSEKLSAVGKLAASIAHEFNNPICGIRNVLHGLRRRLPLAGGDRKLVDMAVRECDRVARLTNDLQSFNRPTSAKTTLLDLHVALEDILLLCKKDMQNARIEVRRDFYPDLPWVKAVPDQLKQVFLNLLTNAREAIGPEGGEIQISTGLVDGEVMVRISDTGSGIAADDLAHIYEPFFSTKPAVKCTGLGLSVSYGIIQRHSGRIEVESEPGRGTSFTVWLPLTEERDKR